MSGLNLFLQAGTVPLNDPLPSSAQALVNYISANTGIAGGSAFNGINFGPNTPAPQNRGLPWFKTDTYGNPIGLFSWNGTTWAPIPSAVSAGPTASRPASPTSGSTYFDTTIQVLILWNATAGNWTTASGSPGDIKEVLTTTLATALTNNPGWQQEMTTQGYVIAGAGNANNAATAHTPGTFLGEEAHTLVVSELAAHAHAEIYGTYTGQHQNGTQPSGVFPAVTPGSTAIPVANTASAGSSVAHNTIQPTAYFYRLVKVY